jgi:predicted nucleic acid-binding protein
MARLDLIERLAPATLVPTRSSKTFAPDNTKTPTAAKTIEWAERCCAEDVAVAASIEHGDLGQGEAQVIAQCVGGSRWAVLDDRAARRCAVAHDVPVIGTLGVVLRAKKNRKIESARPLVKELIAAGMFLDDSYVDRVLAGVGE